MKTLAYVGAAIALLALPMAATAQVTGDYGAVDVVNTGPASNPTVFQLTSNATNPYAGLYFEFTSPLALADIDQLSVDYQMTTGTFGGGSPRFTFFDDLDRSAYVYFGTPTGGGAFSDPLAGAYGSTGNYADLGSADLRVASNGFGGLSAPNSYITFADFVTAVGSANVHYVTLDLDAGSFINTANGGQVMLADNFTVNDNVFSAGAVPEPATWALMIMGFGAAGAMLRRRRPTAIKIAA